MAYSGGGGTGTGLQQLNLLNALNGPPTPTASQQAPSNSALLSPGLGSAASSATDPWNASSTRSDTPLLLSNAGPPLSTTPLPQQQQLANGQNHAASNGTPHIGSRLLLSQPTPPPDSSTSPTPSAQAVPNGNGAAVSTSAENDKVHALIAELCNPATREGALLELSKKREQWDDLALVLWHSFGALHNSIE